MHHEQLLFEARRIYRALGVLPIHIATELMEAGFIVKKLEEAWDKEKEAYAGV